MEIPSLRKLSVDAAIATLKNINNVGDLRYETVRPILAKVESAKQLYAIEQNSPQIIGEDFELWHNFIRRDAPQLERAKRILNRAMIKNPSRYYDLYCELVEEQEAETKAEADKLKAALQQRKDARAANTAEMISGPVAYKEPGRKAGRLATAAQPKQNVANSPLDVRRGNKTVKVSGSSMLAKFRKEAQANPRFRDREMRERNVRNAPPPVPRRSPTTSKSPSESTGSRSPVGGAPAKAGESAAAGKKRKAEELDEEVAPRPAASGSTAASGAAAAGRRPIATPTPRRPAGFSGLPSFMLPNKRQK